MKFSGIVTPENIRERPALFTCGVLVSTRIPLPVVRILYVQAAPTALALVLLRLA
ncbi:hypothetical protein V1277_003275 [Bradyrhizobium sp. AZCC 1588]|uniref:hypothetical protein n=1 Tax=unclassified Bradyrhizobium TaxID=2631580 RepID=UPI002FF32A58